MALLIAACQPDQPDQSQTPVSPTITPTTTPQPLCTPPLCAEDESYYCPGDCPGGCGTVCATHTPAPGHAGTASVP